jgi:hypothetical protein
MRIYHRARWLAKEKGCSSLEEIKQKLISKYGKEVVEHHYINGWKIGWDEKTNRWKYFTQVEVKHGTSRKKR